MKRFGSSTLRNRRTLALPNIWKNGAVDFIIASISGETSGKVNRNCRMRRTLLSPFAIVATGCRAGRAGPAPSHPFLHPGSRSARFGRRNREDAVRWRPELTRRHLLRGSAAALAAPLGTGALAQTAPQLSWPNRPVKVIVPY